MPSFLPINPSLPSLPWAMPCPSLQLDLDVDARGEIELAERVDRLLRGLEDVEQPLVGSHLELLTGFLVDVRRAVDRESLDARRQRNRPGDPPARTLHGLDDLLHGLVEQPVIVRLQANADLLVHRNLLVDFGDDAGADGASAL